MYVLLRGWDEGIILSYLAGFKRRSTGASESEEEIGRQK